MSSVWLEFNAATASKWSGQESPYGLSRIVALAFFPKLPRRSCCLFLPRSHGTGDLHDSRMEDRGLPRGRSHRRTHLYLVSSRVSKRNCSGPTSFIRMFIAIHLFSKWGSKPDFLHGNSLH